MQTGAESCHQRLQREFETLVCRTVVEMAGDGDCHFDLPMRNCTITLDDRVVVSAGELAPELRA